MKHGMVFSLIFIAGFNLVFGAEQAVQKDTADAGQDSAKIQLPAKNSPEYWNVRSEAISELLPFLTKKRAEMKKNQQILTDYLLNIDKASDFADKNPPVPNDPNVYFTILRIGQALDDMGVPKPQKRPSWDEIMDVVMQYVLFEGYLPTKVEEGNDLVQYVDICKKKEMYGQKVRQDLRSALDQCARMWVYLDSINKLGGFKAYYADLKLEHDQQIAQEKAKYEEAHRNQVIAQNEKAQQQKQDDALAREQFQSSKNQQRFEDKQARLQNSQLTLENRLVNSGVPY